MKRKSTKSAAKPTGAPVIPPQAIQEFIESRKSPLAIPNPEDKLQTSIGDTPKETIRDTPIDMPRQQIPKRQTKSQLVKIKTVPVIPLDGLSFAENSQAIYVYGVKLSGPRLPILMKN